MNLDANTKISISVAVMVIGGGAMWMTSIAFQTASAAKSIDAIEIKQSEYNKSIQNIEKDLVFIKTKTEMIDRKLMRGR